MFFNCLAELKDEKTMEELRIENSEFLEFSEDVKVQELQSLEAIFSSSTKLDYSWLSGVILIDVSLAKMREILLNICNKIGTGEIKEGTDDVTRESIGAKSSWIKYLPPVELHFKVTEGYPYDEPLDFRIKSDFLDTRKKRDLEAKLSDIWVDFKDQILFTFVDYLQTQLQEHLDEYVTFPLDCGKDFEKYDRLREYNAWALKRDFEMQTYSCEICQEDFKGFDCHQFRPCKHVFCADCLFEYFSSLIISGDIDKVHCPHFDCTKHVLEMKSEHLNFGSFQKSFDFKEFKNRIMTPPISLDTLTTILASKSKEGQGLVGRYYDLFMKQQFELISRLMPARLVSCPRVGCPEQIIRENMSDPLVVCQKCRYAFCYHCDKVWHGKYKKCDRSSKEGQYMNIPHYSLEKWLENGEGSAERKQLENMYGKPLIKRMADEYLMDKLFNEMLHDRYQGFMRCPTCDIVVQRLDGCNKMCCSSCRTFFCNLCGLYLDPSRAYDHYNSYSSSCYGKLFEGMPGLDP